MNHVLCSSCGRGAVRGFHPSSIVINGPTGEVQIGALCIHCADPARFSTIGLADAIIAEFRRQQSPNTNQKETPS